MPVAPARPTARAGRWPASIVICVLVLLSSAACGGASPGGGADARPLVVATTSILGDVTAHSVGDAARVVTLMPPGSDPHAFEPSPADIRQLHEADLVVANGLGLEEAMADALAAAGRDTTVLPVAEHLDPRPYALGGGALDPHVWLDVSRMVRATELIAARVEAVVAPGAGGVESAAAAYARRLEALDRSVRERLSCVPAERRVLVTNHDALGYLASAYDFEVIGALVPGGGTLGEPSSRQLAELAEAVRRAGVPAVFTDAGVSDRLAEALRAEVGGQLRVVELRTGSLGEGIGSYTEMMATNATRIAAGLGC